MKTNSIAVLLSLVLAANTLRSATITWTNTSGGNWSVAANWSPNQVPGSSDDALITSNGTYLVTLDTSPTINSLTLGGTSGEQTLTNDSFTLTLNNAGVIQTNGIFDMSGGALSGNNVVSGTLNWTGGAIGYGGYSLTVLSNGVLNVSGSAEKDLYSPLTNAGSVFWSGTGVWEVWNNGEGDNWNGGIYNLAGGLFGIQNDISLNNGYGYSFFNNAGLVQKTAGAGETYIEMAFYNSGTVEADMGTIGLESGGALGGMFVAGAGAAIDFDLGTFQLVNASPVSSGAGQVQFTSEATITFSEAITNFTMTAGALSGNNVVSGTLNWTGGAIGYGGYSLTVLSNGVLNLSGSAEKDLYGPLTNAGSVFWSGTGAWDIRNNGDGGNYNGGIYNLAGGLFGIQDDIPLSSAYGYEFFNNAGLVQKTAGAGETYIEMAFYNSGTVEADMGTIGLESGGALGGMFVAGAGAAIDFDLGTFQLVNASPVSSGAGQVQFTSEATITFSEAITNFTMTAGALSGNNVVSGTLNWTGGAIGYGGYSLTVLSNGVLNLSGSAEKDLYGPLTNAGSVFWSGTGAWDIRNNGDGGNYNGGIYNLAGGLFGIQDDIPLSSAYGYEFFNNAGLVQKTAGAGETYIEMAFYNSGTVEADMGTIGLESGGALGGMFVAGAGAAIDFDLGTFQLVNASPVSSGAGQVQFTSEATITFSEAITNFTMTAGALSGNNVVSGTLNWTGGAIGYGGYSLTVLSNGVLNLSGSAEKDLYGPLTNAGSVFWSGTGAWDIRNNGDGGNYNGGIYNLAGGLFGIQDDIPLSSAYGYEFFNNAGLVQKTAGAGETYIEMAFYNSGTVEADMGTIGLESGGALGGMFVAGAGAAIDFDLGTFQLVNASPVSSGAGQVQFTSEATITFSEAITNFTMTAGALSGNNVVSGTLNWTGGAIGYGGYSLTVLSNGVLNLSGSAEKDLYGPLTNAGSVFWSGTGAWDIRNNGDAPYNGAIYNQPGGLFNIQCDLPLNNPNNAAYGFFNNAGLVQKTAGAGETYIELPFYNSGTVEADSGTISFQGDYSNSSSADLAISLAGTNANTDYGAISFGFPLMVDGTFSVLTRNGFQPAVGQVYDVLSFPASTNGFQDFASPSGAIFQTNYTATSFVLTNVGQITWATPTNITYGAAIGPIQLNASTAPAISGDFAYDPVSGTVLDSGVGQPLTAGFSPSDPTYAPASYQVPITVLKAPLGITATNESKTYGQNFTFAGTEFLVNGLVNGDFVTDVSFASSGAISNAPVSGSPYEITPYDPQGDAGLTNYIIGYSNALLTVNRAPLAITADSFAKTYGSNVVFAGTEFVSTTLSNNETIGFVSLSSSGAMSNAPVSGSPYEITPGSPEGGTFTANNYTITFIPGNLTVNRAILNVTANAASRIYGASNPGFTATYSGFVNNETAGVVGGIPNFITTANATSGIGSYTVTPSAGTLTAANYAFGEFLGGTLTVTAAPLNVASGLTANNKVYDRTTIATLSSNNVVLTNIFNSDAISLNTNGYIGNFATSNAVNNITVAVSGLTLTGARSTNYTLTQPTGLTADITAAPVTIASGISANNKVYDRTTTATLSSNGVALSGIVNGDTITLNTNGYTANFAGAEAANGIAVNVTGLTLAGASAADYTLSQPTNLSANITTAPVTITSGVTANNKVYDRTTSATLSSNSVVLSGIVNGDTLSLNTNGYSAHFATAGVGNGIAVSVSGLSLAGASNIDYALTQPGALTASISKAPVTISSGITANNKVWDRTTIATLTSNNVVLEGVVNGDTLALDTNGYIGNFASAAVGTDIAVTVTGLTLAGASNVDYALTQPTGLNADIIAPGVQIFSGLTNITVSWPSNAAAFELNQTATLVPPVKWSPVTNSIVVSGTNNSVNISTSAGKDLYFELIGIP